MLLKTGMNNVNRESENEFCIRLVFTFLSIFWVLSKKNIFDIIQNFVDLPCNIFTESKKYDKVIITCR